MPRLRAPERAVLTFTRRPARREADAHLAIGDAGHGNPSQLACRDAYTNFAGGIYTDVLVELGTSLLQRNRLGLSARRVDIYPDMPDHPVWPTIGNQDTY